MTFQIDRPHLSLVDFVTHTHITHLKKMKGGKDPTSFSWCRVSSKVKHFVKFYLN